MKLKPDFELVLEQEINHEVLAFARQRSTKIDNEQEAHRSSSIIELLLITAVKSGDGSVAFSSSKAHKNTQHTSTSLTVSQDYIAVG
jgi:hypothetical protein